MGEGPWCISRDILHIQGHTQSSTHSTPYMMLEFHPAIFIWFTPSFGGQIGRVNFLM